MKYLQSLPRRLKLLKINKPTMLLLLGIPSNDCIGIIVALRWDSKRWLNAFHFHQIAELFIDCSQYSGHWLQLITKLEDQQYNVLISQHVTHPVNLEYIARDLWLDVSSIWMAVFHKKWTSYKNKFISFGAG